ncbi:hypothetical protein NKI34_24900, partial [Mesorhizobium sp. M0700]|uniref:hypothetical protein n=1 Tax=Mesorhizobium sp. M0700 TaxID=2956988 RepID=UPI00333A9B6F
SHPQPPFAEDQTGQLVCYLTRTTHLLTTEMPANLGKTAFCAYIYDIRNARFEADFSRSAHGINQTGFHERPDRHRQRR